MASDPQVLNPKSLRWTSPESFEAEQPINTSSSDIYSFACVSYEVFCLPVGPLPTSHPIDFQIFSGLFPFHEIDDHAVSLQVIRGEPPSRPEICHPWEIACEDLGLDDETWAEIVKCWDQEPDKRPAAKEVGTFLREKLGLSRSNDESQNTIVRNSPLGFLELIQQMAPLSPKT